MARRKITEVAVGNFGENDHILAELNGALQRITIDSVLKKARFSTAKVDDEGYLHFYDEKEEDMVEKVYVGGASGVGFADVAMDEAGYLHFYDEDGNDVISAVYIGSGGSGGSGSKLTFSITSGSNMTLATDAEKAVIKVLYRSIDSVTQEETGAGTIQISMDGVVKKAMTLNQGITEIDLKEFLGSGTNSFKLTVTDAYGATATRPLTVVMEKLSISWNLGTTNVNSGALHLYVTPVGTGAKTIHVLVDGTEVSTETVSVSGQRLTVTVEDLTHGEHSVECYAEKATGSYTLASEHLTAVVAQIKDGETAPVIAAYLAKDTVPQYTTVEIKHRVIDPQNNPSTISYLVNDVLWSTESVDQSEQLWSYKPVGTGQIKLGILCGTEKWEKTITVEALGSDIQEITDGLAIKVDPATITDLNSWSYGAYTMELSERFDHVNGGLQTDVEGIKYIRICKGDTMKLNFMPFANDARKSGLELKFVYKLENCTDIDATAISCVNTGIGFTIRANDVSCTSEQTKAYMETCEEEKTELDINIKPDTEERTIMFWEHCCPCNPAVYAAGDSFAQSTAQGITIGSENCDVCLYLLRGYNRSLTTAEIKENYYADGKDGDEILERHDRNQIYDSTGRIDLQKVQELCPNLHILTWHASEFSLAKTSKVTGNLSHSYRAGGEGHEWTAYDTTEKVQGTSSVGYAKDAGGNCDFDIGKGITLADNSVQQGYSMSDSSIPVSYLNFKANTASQEHVNNMVLSEWYNRFQPDQRPAKVDNPKIRDTVESQMAVLFFHNTGTKDVQIGPDLVGPDETIFYSLGNLNNSKKNYEVFGQNDEDDVIVVECLNNTSQQCRFKSDDLSEEDFGGDHNFEWRYLSDSVPEDEAKEKFQELISFIVSCDASAATSTNLKAAETYGGKTYLADTAEYRKAKWKEKAPEYMVMESILYHQVFTLTFCMPDNRAKNTFWGYSENRGKWHLDFAYDNDTGMGNDNEGGMTLGYGYLDTDTIGDRDVFNAADNTVFAMNREVFGDELREMYLDRENAGAWDFEALAALCDTRQGYACESLWIEDGERKNIRTMTELGTTAYIGMMNGKKRLQRRKFLKFQRPFMGSYFRDAYNTSDHATIRGYTPSTYSGVEPLGKMTITPYCDMYINVLAGSIMNSVRGYAGEPVEIDLGVKSMNDTEIYPRGAGFIKDMGPLSQLYPGYYDASPLTRIVRSEVGSEASGYRNTNFTGAEYKNCKSLQYVNHEGCPNDTESLNFENNVDLRELYTRGTSIAGVKFPKNGRVEKAYLNGVTSLYVSGLKNLDTLSLESYEQLSSLTVEGTENVDTYSLVSDAKNLTRIRLTDLSWSVPVKAYDTLMRLHNISGLDDDGYNTEHGVLTGRVHFTSISETKLKELKETIPEISFSHDTVLEEHTVTFCDEDGTVLYKATTEHGGAVNDPVGLGIIPVPTKEPTIEYTYEFYKWSSATNFVVEDMTVTATFREIDRYYSVDYTVNEKVVEHYDVIAHGSCSYQGEDPTMDGYMFVGWTKETKDVTEDMICPAEFIYPTMPAYVKDMSDYDYAYSDNASDNAAYSKAEFAGILLGGAAKKYLAVGDKVKLVWDTGEIADTETVFLLHGFNHYKLADESGMAGTTWYAIGVLNAPRRMAPSNTNAGGWAKTEMRTWLNDTLFPEMPPFWRALIQKVKMLSSKGETSAEIVESEDRLYLMSRAEVGFDVESVPYANEVDAEAENTAFGLYTDNNSRIKKTYNGTGSASIWWLRSAEAAGSTKFAGVDNNGRSYSWIASDTCGVCPGFSI